MNRTGIKRCFAAGIVIGLAGWWMGCAPTHEKYPPGSPKMAGDLPAQLTSAQQLSRGKYLVTVLSCADCHTPLTMTDHGPVPDESRAFSGHPAGLKVPPPPKLDPPYAWAGIGTNTAFAGPWGITFAANLTPDKVTGLGGAGWDEARFIKAMRTGKHFGEARPIFPPMPWQGLSQATDQDLKAVWAYLQSVPPVSNVVPDWVPPAK